MDAEAGPVLIALPGTLCPPAVFEPLAAALPQAPSSEDEPLEPSGASPRSAFLAA